MAMIQPWWVVAVGLHGTCDGGRTLIPTAAAAADTMPKLWDGSGGRIPYGALPGATRSRTGGERVTSPPPPLLGVGQDLLIIFTSGDDAPQIPSGGVLRGINQLDQPPDSLFALPHVGNNCDPVEG